MKTRKEHVTIREVKLNSEELVLAILEYIAKYSPDHKNKSGIIIPEDYNQSCQVSINPVSKEAYVKICYRSSIKQASYRIIGRSEDE